MRIWVDVIVLNALLYTGRCSCWYAIYSMQGGAASAWVSFDRAGVRICDVLRTVAAPQLLYAALERNLERRWVHPADPGGLRNQAPTSAAGAVRISIYT